MDENSCENETSESAECKKEKETEDTPLLENVGIIVASGGKKKENQISSRLGSSLDISGPSTVFPTLTCDKDVVITAEVRKVESRKFNEEKEQANALVPLKSVASTARITEMSTQHAEMTEQNVQRSNTCPLIEQDSENASRVMQTQLPEYEDRQESQPRVRLAPTVEEELSTRRPSVGPPPSYSFVMKQKKKLKPLPSLDPLVTGTSPPPSYAGSRGIFLTTEDGIRHFPSLAEPIWRSHSQPALCPRCGIIVLTTTHSHDCIATHVAALALCLFGCWPCCVLPYCMNICKNTYHHCPICQTFLGLYKPW